MSSGPFLKEEERQEHEDMRKTMAERCAALFEAMPVEDGEALQKQTQYQAYGSATYRIYRKS